MEKEVFLSGYCRVLDQSRMVTVEVSEGTVEADCNFGSCPYESACQIARGIREISEES